MADDKDFGEDTALLDSNELEDVEENSGPDLPMPESSLSGRFVAIASLRDRFASFFIDASILYLIYWLAVQLYNKITINSWLAISPFVGWKALLFQGTFLSFIFIYFFLFESIFFATPGKFLCWMYVRRKDGHNASMSAIFVRNILRVIDHLLVLFPALALMELSPKSQRLGDLVAKTIVIKKSGPAHLHYKITFDNLAPATNRILAALLDAFLFLPPAVVLFFLIDPTKPVLSLWLFLILPFVPLILATLCELWTQTSPGKWLFGYIVATEEGFPISLSHALVRNLFRLLDALPFGWIIMAISDRKQRIGDLAGGTLVSKQKRHYRGLIGFTVMSIISASSALYFYPLLSKNHFESFNFSFAPSYDIFNPWGQLSNPTQALIVDHFRFAAHDPLTLRTPAVYDPGETVYFIFEVQGVTRKDREIWIQEDLTITYPDSSIGLNQSNIVDYHDIIKSNRPIELTNNIALPKNALPGTYRASITLRDQLANRQIMIQRTFDVRAPKTTTQETPVRAPAKQAPSLPPPVPPQNPFANPNTTDSIIRPHPSPFSRPNGPQALPAPDIVPPPNTKDSN